MQISGVTYTAFGTWSSDEEWTELFKGLRFYSEYLFIEDQIRVCEQVIKLLNLASKDYEFDGTCSLFYQAIYTVTADLYDDLVLPNDYSVSKYIPLFTRENAIMHAGARTFKENNFYWWPLQRRGENNLKPRIRFLRWILSELNKEIKTMNSKNEFIARQIYKALLHANLLDSIAIELGIDYVIKHNGIFIADIKNIDIVKEVLKDYPVQINSIIEYPNGILINNIA